jgi:hypothetical protein
MKINPIVYGGIVVIVFLGIIFGFQTAGIWSTSGKVSSSGESIQPSASDANSIKGWMTLDQVSSAYGIPLADIISAFDLPDDTPGSTALKNLESDTFSVSMFRTWLAEQHQSSP